MRNKNLNHKNNLLQARRRSGLEPKQVAFLLGKKTTDELYRYENGNYFPNLPTVLKLEIIYRTPTRLLFQDLFETFKMEIDEKRKSNPRLFPERTWFPNSAERLSQEENCFYADILKNRFPSPAEMEIITRHVIALTNTLSDYKQGRNPFSLPPL
jgi:transcriptional regulator with XRE-family HTH domain